MDDEDKKNQVEVILAASCPAGHIHELGRTKLYMEPPGEVLYESTKTSVGGGNPRYAAGYEAIDWGN